MRRLVPALLLILAFPAQAPAQRAHAPRGELFGGYAEQQLTPTRWAINVSRGTFERARDIALYRGAVLARAAGYSHVQLVSFRSQGMNWRSYSVYGTNLTIHTAYAQVEAVNDGNARLRCEASVVDTPLCMTVAVAEVLAETGARLRRSPGEVDADVAAAVAARQAHPFHPEP